MTRLSSVPVLCTLWSFCLSVISAKMVSLTARHGQPSGPNGKYTYDAQLSDVQTYRCLCVYLRVLGGIPKKSERQHQPGGGWRWASYTTHPRGRCCFYFQTCQSSPCLGDQKPSLTNKPVCGVWITDLRYQQHLPLIPTCLLLLLGAGPVFIAQGDEMRSFWAIFSWLLLKTWNSAPPLEKWWLFG